MRLQQDLGMANRSLVDAIRNRLIGGIIAGVGVIALIAYLVSRSGFFGVIRLVVLIVGGLILGSAQLKMGATRHSMTELTSGVATAQTKLDDLKAQQPTET